MPGEAHFYRIGTPGQRWGDAERAAWLAQATVQRSYADEVLAKLDALRSRFDVEQYGALSIDPDRYPLYAVKSKEWVAGRPIALITGGVHGYETSGVQGALLFLRSGAEECTAQFNLLVCPCVSPWGYETIQRWIPNAEDPNRGFCPDSDAEECAAVVRLVDACGGPAAFAVHIDLHETTGSDATEFRVARAARDGDGAPDLTIADGFYFVSDCERPQSAWHAAMVDAVRRVTHIAPADAAGEICGDAAVQEGVVAIPTRQHHLCSSVTNAPFCTTTEVYPDSVRASADQCNRAQVAAVVAGLSFAAAAQQSQRCRPHTCRGSDDPPGPPVAHKGGAGAQAARSCPTPAAA